MADECMNALDFFYTSIFLFVLQKKMSGNDSASNHQLEEKTIV